MSKYTFSWLPLWGNCHASGMTERVGLLQFLQQPHYVKF